MVFHRPLRLVMEVRVLHPQSMALLLPTLGVVVALDMMQAQVLAEWAVVALVGLRQLLALQILVVAAALKVMAPDQPLMAALALSSFVTQLHTLMPQV
jgi:hypothetical protein